MRACTHLTSPLLPTPLRGEAGGGVLHHALDILHQTGHAAGDTQRGQDGRQDGNDELDDVLDEFGTHPLPFSLGLLWTHLFNIFKPEFVLI